MPCVDFAGRGVVLPTQCGGQPDYFAHHAGRTHDADRTEGFVGDADVATRHEQIGNIA